MATGSSISRPWRRRSRAVRRSWRCSWSTTRPASFSRSSASKQMVRAAGSLLLADCAQAAGKIALPEADFIAVSAHKFGGPPGRRRIAGPRPCPPAGERRAGARIPPRDGELAGGGGNGCRSRDRIPSRRQCPGWRRCAESLEREILCRRRRGHRRRRSSNCDDRRLRNAGRGEREPARPTGSCRHFGVGGKRLLVGQHEVEPGARRHGPCSGHRCIGDPRQLRPRYHAKPTSTGSFPTGAGSKSAPAGPPHDLPRLSGDDAGGARSGRRRCSRGSRRRFANPHSPSRWGHEAAAAIEVARKQVEKAIGLKGGARRLHRQRHRGDQLGAQGDCREGRRADAIGSSRSRPSMPPCSTPANGWQRRASTSPCFRSTRKGASTSICLPASSTGTCFSSR